MPGMLRRHKVKVKGFRKPRIRLYRSSDGKFRFTVIAANGEKVGASQGYKTRRGALEGPVKLVQCLSVGEVEFAPSWRDKPKPKR